MLVIFFVAVCVPPPQKKKKIDGFLYVDGLIKSGDDWFESIVTRVRMKW